MNKEKRFHANQLKNGTFICKVQVNSLRKSFYGKTDNEAIDKAKQWYNSQIEKAQEQLIVEPIENPSINNKDVVEQLSEINSLLQSIYNVQSQFDLALAVNDKYMTVKDVSEYLKISINQAYSLINQPDFPRQKIGK